MRRRVVCGLSETMATLPPQSALTSVDLPTFGRPATATKPDLTPRASQHERVRKQLGRRVLDELALVVREHDPVDAELHVPLPTTAARRRRDHDQIEVAGAVARGDRGHVR